MPPALSIVTPCLNRAGMITAAIESVMAQGLDDYEHIIIDGGSTDGTLEILGRYPHLKVISEPDKGIYDGLNKGLRMARGRIIGHLNSDDVYEPGCLSVVMQTFADTPDLDSVCGGALLEDDRGIIANYTAPQNKALTFATALLGSPIINARFFTRAFYERCGDYDLAYPLTADRDFLVRSVLAGCRTRPLEILVYRYRLHDGSWTFNKSNKAARRLSLEYRTMARRWLTKPGIPASLATACRQLYGEAVARLAWISLRDRQPMAAATHLFCDEGALSLAPAVAAAIAVVRWSFASSEGRGAACRPHL